MGGGEVTSTSTPYWDDYSSHIPGWGAAWHQQVTNTTRETCITPIHG